MPPPRGNRFGLGGGGLNDRTTPALAFMLATAPPMLTLACPTEPLCADATDPPRFGFRGDMPPMRLEPAPPSRLLRPAVFFLTVADLGIVPDDSIRPVAGAEVLFCDGEEKCADDLVGPSSELSCRLAFSWRA